MAGKVFEAVYDAVMQIPKGRVALPTALWP